MAEKYSISYSDPDSSEEAVPGLEETPQGVRVNPDLAEQEVIEGDQDQQQQESSNESSSERPEWLPEKFKTVEDFVKSYQELEKSFTKQRQQDKQNNAPLKIGGQEESTESQQAESQARDVGVDLDALAAEYAKEGSLSDETYQSLEEKGFSRQLVDRYIAGQQAIAEQLTARLAEAAGGDLQTVLSWAKVNLSQGERDYFDSLIDSNNLDGAILAMRGIHSQYVAAVGKSPNLVGGENRPGTSGLKPFSSMIEASEALADKRYETDAKFRQEVDKRLAISDI